jgi:hypothetical protein
MLGPYGIKLLNETLMWHIQSQVTELRKLVLVNKEILIALRTNFDKPDVMKELFKRLQNVDSVLQRMTIIGELIKYPSCLTTVPLYLFFKILLMLPSPPWLKPKRCFSLLASFRTKLLVSFLLCREGFIFLPCNN